MVLSQTKQQERKDAEVLIFFPFWIIDYVCILANWFIYVFHVVIVAFFIILYITSGSCWSEKNNRVTDGYKGKHRNNFSISYLIIGVIFDGNCSELCIVQLSRVSLWCIMTSVHGFSLCFTHYCFLILSLYFLYRESACFGIWMNL